ncbi:MAG: SH3 domain-containing protein [Desulfovibrionaceae bacterium]
MRTGQKTGIVIIAILAVLYYSQALAFRGNDIPVPNQDSPLPATCTGNGVSLRETPAKSGNKIATLARDEAVYLIGRQDTGEEYPWALAITQAGYRGWVYGQYISSTNAMLTEDGRFKARFDSSVFFDMQAVMRAAGIADKNVKKQSADVNDPDSPHYADEKMSFAEGFTFYLTGNEPFYVIITKKGYKAAGLQVGDTIDKNMLAQFNERMSATGWNAMYEDESTHEYTWTLDRIVDEVKRPVQKFSIMAENGKIKSIRWGSIVID